MTNVLFESQRVGKESFETHPAIGRQKQRVDEKERNNFSEHGIY